MKKILPPILFAFCLLSMVLLHKYYPLMQIAGHPFNFIGIVFMAVGMGLTIAGNRHFSMVGTNIMTFDKPDKLVTTGLFKFSRNPMYLGFSTALLGAGLLAGSLSTIIVAILFVVVTDRFYIRFEENMMQNTFGESYSNYCEQVRRWI